MAQRFRKKPIEIEAMQLDGRTVDVVSWLAEQGASYRTETHSTDSTQDIVVIQTLEGEMRADPGDWVIRGIKGEFYPCKPDIFAATYDEVSV